MFNGQWQGHKAYLHYGCVKWYIRTNYTCYDGGESKWKGFQIQRNGRSVDIWFIRDGITIYLYSYTNISKENDDAAEDYDGKDDKCILLQMTFGMFQSVAPLTLWPPALQKL